MAIVYRTGNNGLDRPLTWEEVDASTSEFIKDAYEKFERDYVEDEGESEESEDEESEEETDYDSDESPFQNRRRNHPMRHHSSVTGTARKRRLTNALRTPSGWRCYCTREFFPWRL